jgi:hypothetical protein
MEVEHHVERVNIAINVLNGDVALAAVKTDACDIRASRAPLSATLVCGPPSSPDFSLSADLFCIQISFVPSHRLSPD